MQASRLDVARDFAVQHQIYVVLKGYRTLIATPEGKVFINPLGNPGMATGGTGDVLTGVLAAWLAQLLDAEAACKIARLPARTRRRFDRSGRGRSGDDGRRSRRASRRRRARADRAPACEAVQWPVLRSSPPIPNRKHSRSAEGWRQTLQPGTFVLLHGDLGAGKTAFVRGMAAGLGANPDDVSSPTFVLIQHYKGRMPLVHVDLYRLESGAAIDDLGLEEMASGAVVAIEWAGAAAAAVGGQRDV